MKISYLYKLFFLGNLWVSVSGVLVEDEGVNKYSSKYQKKLNNNENEGEGNNSLTVPSSSSEKNDDVLEKQNNLSGSNNYQDENVGFGKENNKDKSSSVEDKNDENGINTDSVNQQQVLYDEISEFKNDELKSERSTKYQEKVEKEDTAGILNPVSLTIDIVTDDNTEFCVVKKLDMNNIPTQIYIPRAGYRITKLTDGHETIWESKKGEYSFMVDITLCNGGKPCMILVATKTGEIDDCKYFERNNTKWKELSYPWYYFKLVNKVKLTVNEQPYDLDINRKKLENYTFIDCDVDYIHTNLYFNKPGYKFKNVKDGDHILYTSSGILDPYINIRVTLSEGNPILIKIEGMTDMLTKPLKYQMINNRWELIDDEQYNEVIKRVKDNKIHTMNNIENKF